MAAELGVVDDVEEVFSRVTTTVDDKDVDKGSWLHKKGQRALIRDHDYHTSDTRRGDYGY